MSLRMEPRQAPRRVGNLRVDRLRTLFKAHPASRREISATYQSRVSHARHPRPRLQRGIMNLQLLHQKLPEICLWIDRTLASHQSQARTTDSYAFQRLPKFYPPHLLATTKVIKVARLPVPPLSDLGLTEFAEFERNQY